ncbi:hypothetical protein HID58_063923 [Brassica napus]|uniref:Uncharacterized protein n=1 Tax=Brassica napus TaxID=3708 RepID=A0ABQ7Z8I0_BRANA|nr:hypothetical protein HID58_063923 [Brassica napus]
MPLDQMFVSRKRWFFQHCLHRLLTPGSGEPFHCLCRLTTGVFPVPFDQRSNDRCACRNLDDWIRLKSIDLFEALDLSSLTLRLIWVESRLADGRASPYHLAGSGESCLFRVLTRGH